MLELLFVLFVVWWFARGTIKFLRGMGEAVNGTQKATIPPKKQTPSKRPGRVVNVKSPQPADMGYDYNNYLKDQGMSEQDIEEYWDSMQE